MLGIEYRASYLMSTLTESHGQPGRWVYLKPALTMLYMPHWPGPSQRRGWKGTEGNIKKSFLKVTPSVFPVPAVTGSGRVRPGAGHRDIAVGNGAVLHAQGIAALS